MTDELTDVFDDHVRGYLLPKVMYAVKQAKRGDPIAETEEQARLLGMSGERECALRGEIARMRHRIECLRGALKTASGWVWEGAANEVEANERVNTLLALAGDMEPPPMGSNVQADLAGAATLGTESYERRLCAEALEAQRDRLEVLEREHREFFERWHAERRKREILEVSIRDIFPAAHRLALELECLLLDTKDTAAVSKWWDSAHEALEQWREFCREDEKIGAGETATTSALEAEIEAAEFAEAERQIQTGGF